VATVLLVAAIVVGLDARASLRRTNDELASTRLALHRTSAQLASARSHLAVVTAASDLAGLTLVAEDHQLSSDQAALDGARSTVSTQGADITALGRCLAGVEQSLNQTAAGDQAGAAASLANVAGDCSARTAS
jgi:hypothetical protein